MPVIAVINRKGGSGKSTIAAHLAAWLAHQGTSVMLGDIDRQQSARAWLKRRDPTLPVIMPWVIDKQNILKAPVGVTHVVLDTPGGLHGLELARVIMSTDMVIMPVCSSVFDRESAAACLAELAALPKVVSGRCKLGVIGMRVDMRTNADEVLSRWARNFNVPFLGVLRETQLYVKCIEDGQTLFDMPAAIATIDGTDLSQWETILQWLHPFVKTPTPTTREATAHRPISAPATGALRPRFLQTSASATQPAVLRVVERPIDRLHAARAAHLGQAPNALRPDTYPATSTPTPATPTSPAPASEPKTQVVFGHNSTAGAVNFENQARVHAARSTPAATANMQAIPKFLLRRETTPANAEPAQQAKVVP